MGATAGQDDNTQLDIIESRSIEGNDSTWELMVTH
jgi:hypothetical protein